MLVVNLIDPQSSLGLKLRRLTSRRLLCPACNIALGLMKEDRMALQSMVKYLEES